MLGFHRISCSEHTGYRFGFNGMEKDDEVNTNGNSLDFGSRFNDPRLGRWLSRDEHFASYPAIAPYSFAGNTPIVAKDGDGKDIVVVGDDAYRLKVYQALISLSMRSERGYELVKAALQSEHTIVIGLGHSGQRELLQSKRAPVKPGLGETHYMPYDFEGVSTDDAMADIGHELSHWIRRLNGTSLVGKEKGLAKDPLFTETQDEYIPWRANTVSADELPAMEDENLIRAQAGLPLVPTYKGIRVMNMQIVGTEWHLPPDGNINLAVETSILGPKDKPFNYAEQLGDRPSKLQVDQLWPAKVKEETMSATYTPIGLKHGAPIFKGEPIRLSIPARKSGGSGAGSGGGAGQEGGGNGGNGGGSGSSRNVRFL